MNSSHLCLRVVAVFALAASSYAIGADIYYAAAFGNLGELRALLKDNPALVFSRDNFGNTPLHVAVDRGQKDAAELLLINKADINARDKSGQTPLHVAVKIDWPNQRDVVELLLANRADVNARDNDGWTPLHWAADRGHPAIAELLLASGANVNAKSGGGYTPLQLCGVCRRYRHG